PTRISPLSLHDALPIYLGDHFAFVIAGRRDLREAGISLAERYRIECAVGGTLFETLQVDVTVTPPAQWEVEAAQRPGLLADVGLDRKSTRLNSSHLVIS